MIHTTNSMCVHVCVVPRALMVLNELSSVREMSDVTRNNLFPSAEEVTALSVQFALPATASLTSNNGMLFSQKPLWFRS